MTKWTLRNYLLGAPPAAPEPEPDVRVFQTGRALIQRIQDAIQLRRSVLVTGPRGSGKSYCSERAIADAKKQGHIGASFFLQGNREIPRDYLSEDMLVLEGAAPPVPSLKQAIVLRNDDSGRPESLKHCKHWPAIEPKYVDHDVRNAFKYWGPLNWSVLFLDEINRFGDGFLDSLLSLTEEHKIVRRGEEYYVPICVVATANPPGYDVTAKKLSPPLQARISRSYRVSQPTLRVLVEQIIAGQITRYATSFAKALEAEQAAKDKRPAPPITEIAEPELAVGEAQWRARQFAIEREHVFLCATATLCMWGNPRDPRLKGAAYLTPETRKQLEQLMDADDELARLMSRLTALITFGPDARAGGDWIGCAMGLALGQAEPVVVWRKAPAPATLPADLVIRLGLEHLRETTTEVLGHKLRETFNEGGEPGKLALKEDLIQRITNRLLDPTSAANQLARTWAKS